MIEKNSITCLSCPRRKGVCYPSLYDRHELECHDEVMIRKSRKKRNCQGKKDSNFVASKSTKQHQDRKLVLTVEMKMHHLQSVLSQTNMPILSLRKLLPTSQSVFRRPKTGFLGTLCDDILCVHVLLFSNR